MAGVCVAVVHGAVLGSELGVVLRWQMLGPVDGH